MNFKIFSLAFLLCHLPRSIFLFFHRGDRIKSENRADNIGVFSLCYRLCVLVSGSCTMNRVSCQTALKVSCLHWGQNNGKFSRTVSLRILNHVLLPQKGRKIHSFFMSSSSMLAFSDNLKNRNSTPSWYYKIGTYNSQ